MDKDTINHSINVLERKSIVIKGVKKIESFDNEEFLLETNMGYLDIKGSTLEIVKLDTIEGVVSIKGKVNSLIYLDNNSKSKSESVFSKLFK